MNYNKFNWILLNSGESSRKYYLSENKQVVKCLYNKNDEYELEFSDIAKFLNQYINVPKIYDDDKHGTLYMEYLGNRELSSNNTLENYKLVIDELIKLQNIDISNNKYKINDKDSYDFIFRYFYKNVIEMNNIECDKAKLFKEFEFIRNNILKDDKCYIHNDLHSNNILIKEGKPYFIDFQGLRVGNGLYDLASLLYDVYTDVGDIDELKKYYFDNGKYSSIYFKDAAILRLLQMCGSFGCFDKKFELLKSLYYLYSISKTKYTYLALVVYNILEQLKKDII